MNSIIQQITDWLKGLLVLGIMNNLTNTFSFVNVQVGQMILFFLLNTYVIIELV